MTSTATSRSSTTSVQRERSAPWTTRGRVETNISPHGLLFFNGLWQRYISSRCVVFPTSFLQRRAEQRRVFAPPCVHPRAGRQCIALTKRKACRASLLWAKRRRGGAVWSSLTSTKAGEFKTKLKINHLRSSPGLLSSRVSTSTAIFTTHTCYISLRGTARAAHSSAAVATATLSHE